MLGHDPKIDFTIDFYEMSVVARALCANDGTLFIPSDKSTLMNLITAIHGPVNKSDELPIIRPVGKIPKVMIIDAMAVLETMKKTQLT